MTLTQTVEDKVEIPTLPTGTISVQPPPDRIESGGAGGLLANLLPMLGSVGMLAFMFMGNNNPRMMLMGGGMVLAMVGLVGFNVHRQVSGHRRKVTDSRREYLAYLSELRETVRTAADLQRRHMSWQLPDPRSMVLISAHGRRLWERADSDDDPLLVRLGTSTQQLSMSLDEPDLGAMADPDPVCHSAMHRFVRTHSDVDNMPFSAPLGAWSHVEVCGPDDMVMGQVRAMICHLALFVPPTSLKVAVLCAEDRRAAWEWLKWLPHARSSVVTDALGPARMVVSDPATLEDMLGEEITTRGAFSARNSRTPWPHVVLVTDGASMPANTRLGSMEGTTGVTVVTPQPDWEPLHSRSTLRLITRQASAEGARPTLEVAWMDHDPLSGVPDRLSTAQAEAVARRMTPHVSGAKAAKDAPVGRSDPKRSAVLTELLHLGDVRDFDPERQWKLRLGRDRLRVPFGVTPEGIPVSLDIKEAAEQGMGPHGLLIGATGSGKSEVLRTLALALALTHSPEQLNFVLVDFKGGATFAGMSDLPHVSAMISNLESELSLVDRMQEALRGEMVRRQEMLRDAGNYSNVTSYEEARREGKHSMPPLPALFVIVDEFSEMLSAKPDFIDLFVAIGRLGRSMAIHLLLASQRLEEGRLRGLESHLSYRVGLRTFSSAESRNVLGVTSAYELPSVPGVGYLKAGTEDLIRFRASYVASPPPARRAAPAMGQAGSTAAAIELMPFTTTQQVSLEDPEEESAPQPTVTVLPGDAQWADMSQMDIAVALMAGHGLPAHQVWLPPLDVPDTFDVMMPDLEVDPDLGLVSRQWREAGRLRIPLGVVDVPLEQRREPLVFDLSGAAGHAAVIGAPLTGKSTALRTLVMGLSLTHTPLEVQFYILDFGGGSFSAFEGAAHIAGVGTRDRPDVVERTIAEVEGLLSDREKYFRQQRIDSMSTYRDRRARGEADDGYGDVFLVVDGWSTLRSDFDMIEMRIQVLAARALTYGVHLVIASGRWMDLRQQIRDVIGSRLELRLGDAGDSVIGRKAAERVPEERPGRGIEEEGHHVLVALPRADGDPNPDTLGGGVTTTLERIADAWQGQPPPKLRLLPTTVELPEVLSLDPERRGLLLGIEESRLGQLVFDPTHESHLFLFGDSKSGKSTFLRSLLSEIMRTHTAKQAQVMMVDFRRSLLGEIPEEYLAGYAAGKEEAHKLMDNLAGYLKTRMPGDDVTPEQLRSRSWWSGAEVWVLVDDYDLVATTSGNPLLSLQPLMAQARDVGLHIVVTRRSGGASRAMYEPVIQTMTELGTTGVLLSGSPDEGQLIGKVKPMKSTAGRAQVVSRDAGRVVAQLAFTPPMHD